MIKPIFSIIIPTYNSLKTLDKTLRSVLKQSFKHYEIIIVDDGSTDNTFTKLKSFKDTRIKLFKIKRSGGQQSQEIMVSQNQVPIGYVF